MNLIRKRAENFMNEAKEKLAAAKNSINSGYLKSAAHDTYFAGENAARALLLALEGNVPKDKNKIWTKITNYQRCGLISSFNRKDIELSYRYRSKADYVEIGKEIEITKDSIVTTFALVKRFVDEVEKVLRNL